ncbi:glycosyltransferase family 4 protein [Flavobacterium gilvum]|uniref:Glycosyl transferase family 1 domain-containing protein n=1 Tax=Flavobacterium gilvum TaxID=1492737 RepID=A0AAC9I6S2_9FLAO|nr:glycosyltransferase family 4 protein [Flavobacterium gilvum]AOW11195.1 hypothetical protein EM308_00765 [Flavobacterium gilvum]KFC59353.1 group 1 glycosyl transferase [Flavobacterium gilvum]
MRVLWIVNTIFPAPSEKLGIIKPVLGGWMYGLAEQVAKQAGIKLGIVTTHSSSNFIKMQISGIDYFLIPCKDKTKYDVNLEPFWVKICEDFMPDIIHIHGTEYAHGLSCIRKFPNLRYIVSIQGLVGIYSRYYFAGISSGEIFTNITFRDLIKRDTIFQAKQKFANRGNLENEYLINSKHAIGRTGWDFAHVKSVNPNINYHFCNESLRDGFYTAEKWKLESCEPYTIFLSQAGYPIKGLHKVIEAASLLTKDYPKLKIRIGGVNIISNAKIIDRIKRTGYGKYIGKLIEKNKLEKNVLFLGSLSEEQMILEYQNSNVFICPSSIENSPNSLGEAQLIGVPTIASYSGGTPDMIESGKTGLLYRFEEIEMLAENIRKIFSDSKLVSQISENSIISASLRHDREINLEKTISIYNKIANS